MMNYFYWNHGFAPMGFGLGLVGFLITIAWWALVIWLIVMVVHRLFGHDHFRHNRHFDGDHSDTALDILKQRYARGEITKKEFDAMRKDIE